MNSAEFSTEEENASCSGGSNVTNKNFHTFKYCWDWAEGPPNPTGGARMKVNQFLCPVLIFSV